MMGTRVRRVATGLILLALVPLLGPSAPGAAPPGAGYPEALARLDARIAQLVLRAEARPDSWLAREWIAEAHLERAGLSGSYRDYRAAESWLDQAFALSGEAGPFTTRARLHYRLHRFADSAADLDRAERRLLLSDTQTTALLALRADIAFQRGRYDEAHSTYQDIVERQPDATNLFRLASFHRHTGDLAAAERYLTQARTRVRDDPQLTSFLELHLGLLDLDRGHYRRALGHYRRADAAFAGWWLIEEHLAEVHALLGHRRRAEALYRSVIASSGQPEFLDALAQIALSEGRSAEAEALIAEAEALFLRRLEDFPEASYGHALEHFLLFEEGTRIALDLAERNVALRPNGETTMLLAQALLKAGELRRAHDAIERALASDYDSAELHATAALVAAASGDRAAAERARAAAEAIHPDALANLAWLADAAALPDRALR